MQPEVIKNPDARCELCGADCMGSSDNPIRLCNEQQMSTGYAGHWRMMWHCTNCHERICEPRRTEREAHFARQNMREVMKAWGYI